MKRPINRLAIAAALLVLAGTFGARAEDYPARAVTVIVPFAPGGPADVTGRIVADIFSRYLGKEFIVENVGGAGGASGYLRGAAGRPGGYTTISGPMCAPAHAAFFSRHPAFTPT